MTLRNDLLAILKKHGVSVSCSKGCGGFDVDTAHGMDLLDALEVICTPRALPEREALVKMLGIAKTTVRMNIDVHQLLDVCEAWSASGRRQTFEGLERAWKSVDPHADFKASVILKAIWRYLQTGEEEAKPRWCIHCQQDGGTVGGITYTSYPAEWKFCPICAAPRPMEPR